MIKLLLIALNCVVQQGEARYFPKINAAYHETHWQQWMTTFERKYHSVHEENARNFIWLDNMRKITMSNQTYELQLNSFGDMTQLEYHNFLKDEIWIEKNNIFQQEPSMKQDIPDHVDWRIKGCITPVHNQGMCGQSWPMIATDSIASQQCIKTGTLINLSEQNLLDCCPSARLVDGAYKCIEKLGGIDTEKSYPFKSCQPQKCRFNKATIGAKLSGYIDIPSGDEKSLQSAVAFQGPVAAIIDASHTSFQFYRSGVYNEVSCSDSSLDHVVLIVGYGSYNGEDYWLVKNSWGTSWGMNGYIMMSRNKNNQCGIASRASYPQVQI